EKPPYPACDVPPESRIGLAEVAKAEVLGPSRHETVPPGLQLWPRRRVAPKQQGVDLSFEPLLGLLRGPGRKESLPGFPMPSWTEGITQEVERLFSGVTEARLGGMDRQTELLQPPRHLLQACYRL